MRLQGAPTLRWRGIPVILHWSLLLWPVYWIAMGQPWLRALIAFPAAILLMFAHEAGHAIVARMRHTRVHAIKLFGLHGMCTHELPYSRLDDVLIAWGGVAAQAVVLLIALLCKSLLAGVLSFQMRMWLDPVFSVFIAANCVMAIINLLPFRGLDGSKAWQIVPMMLQDGGSKAKGAWKGWRKQQNAARQSKEVADDLINRLRKK